MADSNRDHSAEQPAAFGKRLYRFLTRVEVLGAVYIVILCAVFVLDTRLLRNLFYLAGVPLFLLTLPQVNWSRYANSVIAKLVLVYLGYFLASGLWSKGLSLQSFADLLRVTLLLLLFLVMTLHLATSDARFGGRLFFWLAVSAGVSLLAVFAAAAANLLPFGTRFGGFGLTGHPVIGSTLYGFVLLVVAFDLLSRAKGLRPRLLWIGVIALCATFMLLSGSRGPLFALAASLAVGFAIAERRMVLGVAILVIAGIGAGALFDFYPIEIIYQRAPSGHFDIWQQTLAAIAERPWLGHGSLTQIEFELQNYGYDPGRSPHNLLLANQFYGGLPATLLLGALLLVTMRRAGLTQRQGQPIYLALLVFALVASLFDTRSLAQNLGREWITLWLPIGLLAAQEAMQRRTVPSSTLHA